MQYYKKNFSLMYILPGTIIPFIILFSTSMAISYKLSPRMNKITPNANEEKQKSLTNSLKMILAVSIYFLITSSPMIILVIMSQNISPSFIGTYLYHTIHNGSSINVDLKLFEEVLFLYGDKQSDQTNYKLKC